MSGNDDHMKESGEDEGFSPAGHVSGAAAETAGDSVDQLNPANPSDGNAVDTSYVEKSDKKTAEDMERDDAFVDCPDDIENSDSQQNIEEKHNQIDQQSNESNSGMKVQDLVAEIEHLHDMHKNAVAEKERSAQEYEEERALLMKELAQLCYQLKTNEQQTAPGENVNGSVDHPGVNWDVKTVGSGASLHEIMSECSQSFKNASEDRLRAEEKVRDLDSVLHQKDQEIDVLNAKVAELSELINLSKYETSSQLYELQHIEETADRILALVYGTHHQDNTLAGSITEKIASIENSVTFLVEKCNNFVSESDQLRGVLNEVGVDFNILDENRIFAVARDKISELGRKEQSLYQNISSSEDENRKLTEQLEQQKSITENLNSEIGRLTTEVEQERNRYANTKEKLSMAVTKGKSLVQHRDSLKQMLAEKTSELQKLTTELQEKSAAVEAAEKTKELFEETEKLTASLQESLAQRDSMISKCEEILSEFAVMEDAQLMDITEKLRWVADENKSLKALSLQYHKVTDALLLIDLPETVASKELDVRVRWLAESFYLTKEEASMLQYEIVKTKEAASLEIEHLTTSFLLEIQEKSYLQAELEDLRNKYDAWERLQYEHAEARETLNNEINHLKDLVSSESQGKSYLQLELENLKHNYEGIVQKEHLASLEKHKTVSMLLEASGLAADGPEEVYLEHSDMTTIFSNCLAKIIENASHIEPSLVDDDKLERFKSLLFITYQELNLYKLIVEEDTLDKMQVSSLLDELEMKTQKLNSLNDEKATMKRSLDQLEDRCALLKEKLSMAVKKGKGLVQERETKNAEITRLKSELQQSLSKCTECQDQISKMSLDMEHLPSLEAEIVATKERADQLEQYLAESNSMLQRVMESIESVRTPTDLRFEGPVEKIKWIAESFSEHETSKMEMEQDVSKLKDEASSLASKLSEAQMILKSLEDALSNAETSNSQLLDKKKELEVSKALLEEEMQNERQKASSLMSKFAEVSTSKRTLEDALSQAEENISGVMNQRDIAVESRARCEEQLHKLKEELQNEMEKFSSHITSFEELYASKRAVEDALSKAEDNVSRLMNERDIAIESRYLAEEQHQKLKAELSGHMIKLADAEKTIQSLEDGLSQAWKNISELGEANNHVQIGRDELDSEIKKLREEVDSYASKLSDASQTIISLEDVLANAKNNMADLVEGKKNAEQEILSLTSKLESHTEEVSKTRGSITNLSIEFSGRLSRLQSVLKDETLSSMLEECFKRKFESLGNMDSLLKEMWEHILEMDSDTMLQNSPILENDSPISRTLPSSSDTTSSSEMLNDEVNAVDHVGILSHMEKMNERFHLKSKILADKLDILSTHMDKSITALLRRLHTTKDRMMSIMKCTEDLRRQVKDMKKDKQRQEEAMASLEDDLRIVSSACTDATQGLVSHVRKSASELMAVLDLVKLEGVKSTDLGAVDDDAAALSTDHVKTAERLLLATRRNQDITRLFQVAINKLISVAEDVQEEVKETQLTNDDMLRERDMYKDRISKLEADQKAQENFCHEMVVKLDAYKEREDLLRKREEELSTSLSKVQEYEGFPLSAAQVKLILDKMNEVEVPDTDFTLRDSYESASFRKLFYVLDTFSGTQQKVHILSHENEELQSMIDTQILEIETLKKQVEDQMDSRKSSDKINKLLDLESGLQKIIWNLGGSDSMSDLKFDGEKQLLPLLDKLVTTTIQESENLKSKNEELGAKLLGTQKVVDELSNKIKLLEDSNQSRAVQPEVVQEAGTSSKPPVSTQSEISEMQDVAAISKSNNVLPVSTAAHVRTLRKGSSDHLALNIDSDSERLVGSKESDVDKGHVFKSLNTSGLIPRQGRTVADRIDGVWVSGSRALMSHPRGRLGLLTYWIVVHIWLLGTLL